MLMRRSSFGRLFSLWQQNARRKELGSFEVFLFYRRIQIMHKTTWGRKPKKKVYHRDYELDRVMELRKKPSLILRLISIIQSQKSGHLLLRDLEKFVGFVEKWNYMAVIEKYPSIFLVFGGQGYHKSPPGVTLSEKAQKIASLEPDARAQMESLLVRNLRKLLMLSVDCRLPLKAINLIAEDLGLPSDFRNTLIPKYPHYFRLSEEEHLHLENWDSSLAVTSREQRLELVPSNVDIKSSKKVSRDGNFPGPFAFCLKFPTGFRPNTSYLDQVQRWQRLEFPSPYLNARRFEVSDPKARKRAVSVLHELLSLTMEKRLTSAQLDAFRFEYLLPARLVLCLIKHHGIFYLTNKGVFSTVLLKEGYDGSRLVDKCPLLEFRDKFLGLMGRNEDSSASASSSSIVY